MNGRTAIFVFIRGICMGAADLVPGVSGGTIAFISGIYPRLLAALAMLSTRDFWRTLFHLNIRRCWQIADGGFLTLLFAGILIAVLLLASLLQHWLATAAHLLLAFFFGLVLASLITVYRRIANPTGRYVVYFAAAMLLTLYIVSRDSAALPDHPAALFGGGMVAICAMILPGISGSYILLILGLYPAIINAVHERELAVLGIVALGCATGLLLFSRLLSLLLRRAERATMSVLLGVMVGALPKLWPWKSAATGEKIILQPNVLPADFAGSPDIGYVVLLTAIGFIAVLLIDNLAGRQRLV